MGEGGDGEGFVVGGGVGGVVGVGCVWGVGEKVFFFLSLFIYL